MQMADPSPISVQAPVTLATNFDAQLAAMSYFVPNPQTRCKVSRAEGCVEDRDKP